MVGAPLPEETVGVAPSAVPTAGRCCDHTLENPDGARAPGRFEAVVASGSPENHQEPSENDDSANHGKDPSDFRREQEKPDPDKESSNHAADLLNRPGSPRSHINAHPGWLKFTDHCSTE